MRSGAPNATNSGRTLTDSLGKSAAEPSDHFTSRSWNGPYSRVCFTYCLTASTGPPTVPLMPWAETMILPVSPRDEARTRCHRRTASGSATGAKR